MKLFVQIWVFFVGLIVLGLIVTVAWKKHATEDSFNASFKRKDRVHLDHSAFFDKPFKSGHDVTRACLNCHNKAAKEVMATAHFRWLSDKAQNKRTGKFEEIGKRNLLNNFCIGIRGNEAGCTKCHAGYGWKDASFDFSKEENVDCLVCHDRSGGYVKGIAGLPEKDVDLLVSAQSVGFPLRENCGSCHSYGGGGKGVKHGDLDPSLDYPDPADDVHMGRAGMICIDCHGGHGHLIRGKAFSVSVDHDNGIGCVDCHQAKPHHDKRLDEHTDRVSCQACHIPTYANKLPTKTYWDWSKAGDDSREEDVHHYLKIKGEFEYGESLVPEYYWFDLSVDRYLLGDPIAEHGPTNINTPRGTRKQHDAKLWPFRVHRGKQPYDAKYKYIIPPVTSGDGGYWHEFDWDKALALGADRVGLEYSGQYAFVDTQMFWPLSHLVVGADRALQCNDCHGERGRLDWRALGYGNDPMQSGAQ
ncbi:MAG: tetrathionate reductase family octaheme c-type cytochrome [Myxococcales bacterium]|nr:MAG: tetrathionate reductase family octaheme c-type cytochrome [Myxococcales bacterium]